LANRIAKGLFFSGFAVISNIVYDSVVDPDPNADGDSDSMGSLAIQEGKNDPANIEKR
jgi:hypothetical protein